MTIATVLTPESDTVTHTVRPDSNHFRLKPEPESLTWTVGTTGVSKTHQDLITPCAHWQATGLSRAGAEWQVERHTGTPKRGSV